MILHLRRTDWSTGLPGAVLAFAAALSPAVLGAEGAQRGEDIYRRQCAECHGGAGEGTADGYDKALAGDRTIDDLAGLIAETMPEDDPASCVGEDAQAVAAYIFDAFYSEQARARQKPPRVELSRLTVRQYEQAAADLVGTFRRRAEPAEGEGLRGRYSKSGGRRRGRDGAIERLDPVIEFDFGESSPAPDEIGAEEFSIRWEGSVRADETGDFEFIIKSKNGARLWVNDLDQPLIDASVRSSDNETDVRREKIRLLGGRVYPLRLEFFKSEKAKEKVAAIRLLWKPPGGVERVIPARFLSPGEFPELLVIETPFPPDDKSVGYERGTSISKEWDEATTYAAIEVAGYVAEHLEELAGVRQSDKQSRERLRDFCRRFAERAMRRPLTDAQRSFYVDRHFEGDGDVQIAAKKSLLLVLKSPRFLYREIGGGSDPFDVASRLSFTLWDSLPDEELLTAAAEGRLDSREQIVAQGERMLGDRRAKAKVKEFFGQWLRTEHLTDISKDAAEFPGFDESLVADLRTSLDLFIDDVVWGDSPDFRRLLLAEEIYLNGPLAEFYGGDLPHDAGFQKVSLDDGRRAGVLTHPLLLAGFAYFQASSPIHRGVFVSRSLLGRSLRPPPEAVAPLAPDLHPDLTTRERVTLQTSHQACNACHGMINPLGFPLEQFDASGRFRTEEQGKPIDAGGRYRTLADEEIHFSGPRELAEFLASSPEVHAAFAEQLFHHLVKQPLRAWPGQPDLLVQSFTENDYNIRRLLVEIARVAAQPPVEQPEE